MKPQITVTIDPDGNTEVAANGVTGRSCQDLTQSIEQAIGTTTDDVRRIILAKFTRSLKQEKQTMEAECPLEVTQKQIDELTQCEAVAIREYERADGSRFSTIIRCGDADEMQDVADTPGIFVVPVGLSIVCQQMVLVADLLGQ